MTTTAIMVGMAEIHVIKGPGVFTCLGLGSCIGICAIDTVAQVSGCAHILLPQAFKDKPVDKLGKFADTGTPELLAMMERMGAIRSRIVVAIAGGAQVFKFGGGESKLDIGARNAVAVEQALLQLGIKPVAKDVGGNSGRTVTFHAESGLITVRTAAQGDKPLCTLRKG